MVRFGRPTTTKATVPSGQRKKVFSLATEFSLVAIAREFLVQVFGSDSGAQHRAKNYQIMSFDETRGA
jgi:hypothetical protein